MDSFSVHTFIVGSMKENTYVISNDASQDHTSLIIDPGDDWEYVSEHIGTLSSRPVAILLTHGHFDHVMAAFPLSYLYKIPVFMNPKDRFLLKRLGSTAKRFIGPNTDTMPPPETKPYDVSFLKKQFDSSDIDIIEVPGHTPGSVAVRVGMHVFSGDTVFAQGLIGRTDFSYGDKDAIRGSVQRLLSLPETVIVYSGHGEETTVGNEKVFHALLEKVE